MNKSILSILTDLDLDNNTNSNYNYYILDESNNNITIGLPTIPCDGCYYKLIRLDNSTYNVTLTAKNQNTINNKNTIDLSPNQVVSITSFNNNWIGEIYNISF